MSSAGSRSIPGDKGGACIAAPESKQPGLFQASEIDFAALALSTRSRQHILFFLVIFFFFLSSPPSLPHRSHRSQRLFRALSPFSSIYSTPPRKNGKTQISTSPGGSRRCSPRPPRSSGPSRPRSATPSSSSGAAASRTPSTRFRSVSSVCFCPFVLAVFLCEAGRWRGNEKENMKRTSKDSLKNLEKKNREKKNFFSGLPEVREGV